MKNAEKWDGRIYPERARELVQAVVRLYTNKILAAAEQMKNNDELAWRIKDSAECLRKYLLAEILD